MTQIVVIGAGLSGLAAAWEIEQRVDDAELTVLESSSTVGGKIRTRTFDGFTCEEGPSTYLDKEPATRELCQQLGLSEQGASDAAEKRFIYAGGALREVAMSPLAFMRSPILSWPAKARLMVEPLIPRGHQADESVASFARRRIGEEGFRRLVDAMQSGIYAGDPEQMSVKSCFPRVVEVEAEYGSLFVGMAALMRKRKRGAPLPGAGPSGRLTSLPSGLQQLTDTLDERIGGVVRCDAAVEQIEATHGGGFVLTLAQGASMQADVVVCTAPAHASARFLSPLDPGLGEVLAQIPYAPMLVACLGYPRSAVQHPLDGFGFLAPRGEGLRLLGALFSSTIFSGRTPDGQVMLRAMIGGVRDRAALELSDEETLELAHAELSRALGIHGAPCFGRLFRHASAIPQYTIGHAKRLEQLDAHVARHRGLVLGGNALRGIGINDCIRNARSLADSVAEIVNA